MVRITPPPVEIKDRAVYDYLYELQEYLAVVIDRLENNQTQQGERTTT
jgi:hypothetical protein